jgi:hypothetical protein
VTHDRTQSEIEEMETAQDCQRDDESRRLTMARANNLIYDAAGVVMNLPGVFHHDAAEILERCARELREASRRIAMGGEAVNPKRLYECLVGKLMAVWVHFYPMVEWVGPEEAVDKISDGLIRLRSYETLRPASKWTEKDGPVLCRPPIGDPYVTRQRANVVHPWSPIPDVMLPEGK